MRAGMVADPSEYRWSSYGEAVGGGSRGNGKVIGSRAFVNDVFAAARDRFGARRKDGARRMRGSGSAGAGVLWSTRDLRVGI